MDQDVRVAGVECYRREKSSSSDTSSRSIRMHADIESGEDPVVRILGQLSPRARADNAQIGRRTFLTSENLVWT